jgi:hypothetical protein
VIGGAGHTVTCTFTSGFGTLNALEYSGMAPRLPRETNTGTVIGTALNSGAVNASAASVVVAAMTHDATVDRTITLTSSGWNQLLQLEDVDAGMPMNVGDITSVGASEQASWTVSGAAVDIVGVIAAFFQLENVKRNAALPPHARMG